MCEIDVSENLQNVLTSFTQLILAHFKWLFLEARVDYSGPIPTIIRITREVIRPDMANNIIHGLSTLSSSVSGPLHEVFHLMNYFFAALDFRI